MQGKQEARTGRINGSQFSVVQLGDRLASFAFSVEPEDLIIASDDQPTVEQEDILKTRQLHVQANVPLGNREWRRHAAPCKKVVVPLRKNIHIEEVHAPWARLRVLPQRPSVPTTNRHHTMLLGHHPFDRVLVRHTHTENFIQRVQVMHLYPLA